MTSPVVLLEDVLLPDSLSGYFPVIQEQQISLPFNLYIRLIFIYGRFYI